MCARVSDPSDRWLADDAGFLARLGELDRGLVKEPRADAEASAPKPAASAPRAAPRPINAARALDSSRLLDTTPQPRPLTFTKPAADQPAHRVLIDLFPPSALVPEGTPPLNRTIAERLAAPPAIVAPAAVDPPAADFDVEPPRGHRGVFDSLLIAVAIAVCFLAGSAAALYLSRDAAGRILLRWQNVPLPPGGPLRLPAPIAPIPPPADDTLQRGPAI
jgi:hypothetical protein